MKKGVLLIILFAVSLSLGQTSFAQLPPPKNQGWVPDEPYGMLYDPATRMVITGRIAGIEEAQPGRGAAPAIYIYLRTREGLVVPVLLGPEWYIASRHVPLDIGSVVQVVGSRVPMSSQSVIIASWVQSGNQVLVLRDDFGYAVWEGWYQ